MIDITFQPTQLVIDQINPLSIKLTNSGDKPCTHVYFRLRLPPQIVLLEGRDKIEDGKIDPDQNILLTVDVRPKQIGSWVISSSSFSYQDSQGQSQHPAPLQQEISVISMTPAHGGLVIPNNSVLSVKDMMLRTSADDSFSPDRRHAASDHENEVFVSYTWGGESEQIAEKLEQAFARRGIHLIRDKNDVGYKDSIDLFERLLGQGKCVVLIISDKYLRSEHCMYELFLIGENQDMWNRVFPIVLKDALIYTAHGRLSYIEYWDKKIEELNQAIQKSRSVSRKKGIIADLENFEDIRNNFDRLTGLLKDMNALSPEVHEENDFSILIDAVESRLGKAHESDLSLGEMITIFRRDYVTVDECDQVSQSLESLLGRLSFPPRYMYRKGPNTTRIREINTKIGWFRGICNQSIPKMENDKQNILDLLTDLLQDLKRQGAIL